MPVDSTNGDIVILQNGSMPTGANIIGANAGCDKVGAGMIGGNGEMVCLPPNITTQKEQTHEMLQSPITNQILIAVVAAIISGVVLAAILRRK
jgi:hypothetical protein